MFQKFNNLIPCLFFCRVKAAQNELGQQILADFEEAFPSQGTKVKILDLCFMPSLWWNI